MNLTSLIPSPSLALAAAGSIAISAAAGFYVGSQREHRTHVFREEKADKAASDVAIANATRLATAADAYAQRTAALQPLIVHSKDTVTTYAQTPAGSAACSAPERVLGIDGLDAALFTPPATGGAVALPADAGAPPTGSVGDQR